VPSPRTISPLPPTMNCASSVVSVWPPNRSPGAISK
jgi:hypothetical protein